MEQKQGSSNPGRPQRSANRRRRRRRRSQATGSGPAPAANRRPPAAPPDARTEGGTASARERAPRQPAAPSDRPRPRVERGGDPRQDPPEQAVATRPEATSAAPAGGRGCPLCAEPVSDLYTAIAYGEGKDPAHFDCVVALLGEREGLEEDTRVCYLGGGSFGIVQVGISGRQGERGGTPWVRKRIEVEERDAAPAWRAQLRLPMPEQPTVVAVSEG